MDVSSRAANGDVSINISTNPHPVTVFSIYAPSQTEDPDEDQARKEAFWSHLDTIISDHHNSSHVLILGDFNSRRDKKLDPENDHIGPHVPGKRQSIDDPLRDNAICMLDFPQSHILLLPQTYSDLPPQQQVTYNEMTTTTHFLEDFEVTDWTTLDYAASFHPVFADLTFKGSLFQQIVNTRHLPLLFSYRSSFQTIPKAPVVPKLMSKLSRNYLSLPTIILFDLPTVAFIW